MFALGFFVVLGALYLADSAYRDRNPVTTLVDIIKDPQNLRDTLDKSNTVKITPQTQAMIAGTGGNTNDPLVAAIIAYAQAQVGKPYRWGTKGPDTYDCSGLMWAAYASVGVIIPRTTAGQIVAGTRVSKANLQPGDLVFPYPGHVFMYAGGGRTIEAANPTTGIINGNVYKFFTARRFV